MTMGSGGVGRASRGSGQAGVRLQVDVRRPLGSVGDAKCFKERSERVGGKGEKGWDETDRAEMESRCAWHARMYPRERA